ncbi:unnamed protein product, partial [Symbiodinium sp. KB8]
ALSQSRDSYLAVGVTSPRNEETKEEEKHTELEEINHAIGSMKEALSRCSKSVLQTANQLVLVLVEDVIFSEFDVSGQLQKQPLVPPYLLLLLLQLTPLFTSEWAKRTLEPPKGRETHPFMQLAADTCEDYLRDFQKITDPWFFERIASLALQTVSAFLPTLHLQFPLEVLTNSLSYSCTRYLQRFLETVNTPAKGFRSGRLVVSSKNRYAEVVRKDIE